MKKSSITPTGVFPAFTVFILVFFLTVRCAAGETASRTGFVFDTVVTISISEAPDPDSLLDRCFDLMDELDCLFSRTREGSDVWRINHAGGEKTEVSSATADLIRFSLSWCEQTNGALDITIAPVSSLWDFTGEQHSVPEHALIKEALTHTDYRQVLTDGNTVTLTDPEAMIDLGAVAKGYAADLLEALLRENGCSSALVNLGGNVLALGSKPDGSAWNIGIRKPFSDENEVAAVVPVSDRCVITSGNYERFFILDGQLYHHILDPSTGMSADSGLNSVTIVSASGSLGDALSTACYVMGAEKGMELIESIPDVEALFITKDNELLPSSGWEGSVIKK